MDAAAKLVFEETTDEEDGEMDDAPQFDAKFSLGSIGTSPDNGNRGWCVFFDGLLEGNETKTEPEARLAAARAARQACAEAVVELDAAITELEIQSATT